MEKLNIAKGSVMDLQQKIAVLERTQALQTNDKTHEKFLKQAQEKHAVEMKNMQTQIDVLTDKLNAKVLANSLLKLYIFYIHILSIIYICHSCSIRIPTTIMFGQVCLLSLQLHGCKKYIFYHVFL